MSDRPTIRRDRRKGFVVMTERALYALLAVAGVAVVLAFAVSAYSVRVVRNLNSTVSQIQKTRLDLCYEANRRHDNTFKTLDAGVAKLPAARRAQAEKSLPQTKALLNALAPKRDCPKTVGPIP